MSGRRCLVPCRGHNRGIWLDGRLSRGDDAGVASDPEEETPLEGGGLTEVVRVGESVRRTAGSWTPAVHALLRHLESARFAGAPRSRGIDERGREVLTWVDGEQFSWYADEDLAVPGQDVGSGRGGLNE